MKASIDKGRIESIEGLDRTSNEDVQLSGNIISIAWEWADFQVKYLDA